MEMSLAKTSSEINVGYKKIVERAKTKKNIY